jgi:hypothetical protein
VSSFSVSCFSKIAFAIFVFVLSAVHAPPLWAQAGGAKPKAAAKMTPLQMVQAGRYAEAFPYFKEMSRKSPRDPSINYYLGLCAESVRDFDLAELAFCKIVVGTPEKSPFVPLAWKQLSALPHKLEPQCAIYKDQIHRWDQSAYPLRIFVSDGRTLPNPYAGGPVEPDKYPQVVATIQTALATMPVTPSYKPSIIPLILEGIRSWDWAVRERLFSYKFVADPRKADIVVLFCEQETGYTHFPYEAGQPEILWMGVKHRVGDTEHIELNWMRDQAAHEFGHCLGLCHSNGEKDLMKGITDVPSWDDRQAPDKIASDSDKASLRALFSMPADRIFYPVK